MCTVVLCMDLMYSVMVDSNTQHMYIVFDCLLQW